MDDLKGKEEHPWDVSAEKPAKVDEKDRAPLLSRRNFERGFVSIERRNWYRCFSTPEPSACDIVISLILFITMASTFVWILVTSHHTNVKNAQAYQSDGETSTTAGQTSFNGMTDCPFHRSWKAVVGRRGLPYLQTEAAQITGMQEALQKAQFSNNCCDHGRKLLQDIPPPNQETLKSLDFSDSDTNKDDYPNPGPNPSPPDHGYPPPALRSEMKPEAHSDDVSDLVTNAEDYPNPGPNPSPPEHDYPPPTSWSETKPDVHTDYAPVGPHPSPDYHDYPPPASIV